MFNAAKLHIIATTSDTRGRYDLQGNSAWRFCTDLLL